MNVGLTIRQLRERQGLTRSMLAERAHTTKKTLEDIERTGNLSLRMLERIAEALGVEAQLLLSSPAALGPDDFVPPFPIITVQEAATRLGCHPSNVNRLVREGRLPAIKRGWRVYVDADAVEARRRQQTPQPDTVPTDPSYRAAD